MRVYIASSWKNEQLVLELAKLLRSPGIEVYCYAEGGAGQHIFNWPDVVSMQEDGITCLRNWNSVKAYDIDFAGLNWANVCILVNPCGRDAHLEAGYMKGRGYYLYIIGDFPKGEFSNMYHLADGLFRWEQLGEMIETIRGLNKGKGVKGE